MKIGIVGVGKIARDQHVPAIRNNPAFELTATASPTGGIDGVPNFESLDALIAANTGVEAVSLSTPPAVRYELAQAAIAAGLHVMLEKPPAATLSEAEALVEAAKAKGVVLFASWHSRAAAGVAPARDWLRGKKVSAARIGWREDIRHWHPGQEWILGPGGFGVFDPGINALSILTAILADTVVLKAAEMTVPEGRASPLQASLTMQAGAAPVAAAFDFLQTGPQTWDIEVDTDAGTLVLKEGARVLIRPGEAPVEGSDIEYPGLYRRFAELLARGESDADLTPLRLVADAFLLAERKAGPAFSF